MEGLGLQQPQPGLGLMETAKEQYPILQGLDLGYKYSPNASPGYLEFWPGNETGTPEYPRPKEFPMGKAGVEVYNPDTRPIDILGDVVSHHLINVDPEVKKYYQQFEQSLTEGQHQRLNSQYQYARQYENEKRPYQDWYHASGLPGYFRGYAFQQWPDPESMYTQDQIKMFDNMMTYLTKKK